MQVLPRVTDSSPAKRMMGQLLSSIRTTGTFQLCTTHLSTCPAVHLCSCPPVQPSTCPAVHLSSWASIKTKPISSHSPGSKGAFCELRQGDRRMLDFYTKLGYFNSVSVTEDIVVMGTSLQQWSVSRGSSGHSACVLWSHCSSPSWWELKECFRNGCIILNCC